MPALMPYLMQAAEFRLSEGLSGDAQQLGKRAAAAAEAALADSKASTSESAVLCIAVLCCAGCAVLCCACVPQVPAVLLADAGWLASRHCPDCSSLLGRR